MTFLRFGMSLEESLRTAVADLHALDDPYTSEINIVAVDRDGNHAAAATTPGRTYVYMTEEMDDWVEAARTYLPPEPAREGTAGWRALGPTAGSRTGTSVAVAAPPAINAACS